jgi:hypothetical protein
MSDQHARHAEKEDGDFLTAKDAGRGLCVGAFSKEGSGAAR